MRPNQGGTTGHASSLRARGFFCVSKGYLMGVIEQLAALRTQALDGLAQAADLAQLAEWKSSYLGKKSQFTQIGKELGALPAAERPAIGQQLNGVRQELEAAYAAAEERATLAARGSAFEEERVDVTLPGRAPAAGRLHPSTQMLRTISGIFGTMGFEVWESPEVETDNFNFTLLNMPEHHPARDMQDTFYVETPPGGEKVVLRTHTSPGQIHAMRAHAPEPLRVVLPGKCYRNEQVTARSEMQFHQVEGIVIGASISLADLKGTLTEFARRLYGPSTKTRFRASYFPFTEPSAEMDVECFICGGKGCRICKYAGWLEILGCGMIHPTVLRNGGYDPAQVSGFAFGMGPERITMLATGIDDIRWFFSGDERFLEQF